MLKDDSKSKSIRLVDGDLEMAITKSHAKMDGMAIGLKTCFVKQAWRSSGISVGILAADARTPQAKNRTLFGFCIRGRRGDWTRHRGLLRRSGCAVGAIRGATGYQRKGNDRKAGDDDFFHEYDFGLDVLITIQTYASRWLMAMG